MLTVAVREAVALEYASLGDTADPAILLIAGAGAPADYWPEAFRHSLTDAGFRVIAYNHRDTGGSTHFDDVYALDELLEDLVALLDALHVPAAHLAGHSMGGYLAQMAMARYPARVLSVTSMSAGSIIDETAKRARGLSSPTEETWARLMENLPAGDYRYDLPGWLKSLRFLSGSLAFDEAMATAYVKALYGGDPRNAMVATNHVHAMTTVPDSLPDEVAQAAQPLLVVHGTEDPLVPLDNGYDTYRAAGKARGRFLPLEGAGHMFFNSGVWQTIATAISDFARKA